MHKMALYFNTYVVLRYKISTNLEDTENILPCTSAREAQLRTSDRSNTVRRASLTRITKMGPDPRLGGGSKWYH